MSEQVAQQLHFAASSVLPPAAGRPGLPPVLNTRDRQSAPTAADAGMAVAADQAARTVPRDRRSRQAPGRPGQGTTVLQP